MSKGTIPIVTVLEMLADAPREVAHAIRTRGTPDSAWRPLADIAVREGVEDSVAVDLAIRIIEAHDSVPA